MRERTGAAPPGDTRYGTYPHSPAYHYDASLGTLPEAQGFLRSEWGDGLQPPAVGGGVLHQLPVTGVGAQGWGGTQIPLDFSTAPYVLEASLKVISSNYIPDIGGGVSRSGYYLVAVDNAGKIFSVGIAATGIAINTDANLAPDNGLPFTPFDTTDGFHLYRLEVGGGLGALFIDGVLFGSTAMGGNARPDVPNEVGFGDVTGAGVSETELQHFTFSAVPLPATIWLMGAALGVLAARVRRRTH